MSSCPLQTEPVGFRGTDLPVKWVAPSPHWVFVIPVQKPGGTLTQINMEAPKRHL